MFDIFCSVLLFGASLKYVGVVVRFQLGLFCFLFFLKHLSVRLVWGVARHFTWSALVRNAGLS